MSRLLPLGVLLLGVVAARFAGGSLQIAGIVAAGSAVMFAIITNRPRSWLPAGILVAVSALTGVGFALRPEQGGEGREALRSTTTPDQCPPSIDERVAGGGDRSHAVVGAGWCEFAAEKALQANIDARVLDLLREDPSGRGSTIAARHLLAHHRVDEALSLSRNAMATKREPNVQIAAKQLVASALIENARLVSDPDDKREMLQESLALLREVAKAYGRTTEGFDAFSAQLRIAKQLEGPGVLLLLCADSELAGSSQRRHLCASTLRNVADEIARSDKAAARDYACRAKALFDPNTCKTIDDCNAERFLESVNRYCK